MIDPFTLIVFVFAAFPALLYFANVRLFRPPQAVEGTPPWISLLIPARNEELGIRAALTAALDSAGVELEIIVLDDHSTDRTAAIVQDIAAVDSRVRLESAPPLPEGWNGKQFACFTLAGLAKHETISFLDADVKLAPTALMRMYGFLRTSKAALVSGFPHQDMGTWLERLIVPLINWLLLSYLPLKRMRESNLPALGAGCGQWFLTTKADYFKVGGHGHELVRNSWHDGIKLPRAYRRCGLMTDVCDATDEAMCRMYRTAGQVWNGFAKNAGEGMGGSVSIWIWTILLTLGHIAPFALLASLLIGTPRHPLFAGLALGAAAASWWPRFHACVRYRQSLFGAALHPLGVTLLLTIQWYSLVRRMVGRPVGWKGR